MPTLSRYREKEEEEHSKRKAPSSQRKTNAQANANCMLKPSRKGRGGKQQAKSAGYPSARRTLKRKAIVCLSRREKEEEENRKGRAQYIPSPNARRTLKRTPNEDTTPHYTPNMMPEAHLYVPMFVVTQLGPLKHNSRPLVPPTYPPNRSFQLFHKIWPL